MLFFIGRLFLASCFLWNPVYYPIFYTFLLFDAYLLAFMFLWLSDTFEFIKVPEVVGSFGPIRGWLGLGYGSLRAVSSCRLSLNPYNALLSPLLPPTDTIDPLCLPKKCAFLSILCLFGLCYICWSKYLENWEMFKLCWTLWFLCFGTFWAPYGFKNCSSSAFALACCCRIVGDLLILS